MNREDSLPPLAELFLHVVNFVLPRDSFDCDRPALLRLARVRKNMVEHMKQCSGAFTLDLNMSAKNIVMMSPYPCCHLAYFERSHFEALKRTAARFQSINRLCIDLKKLPVGCNFINTAQILDLVFHCLDVGRAKQLCISNAVFEVDQFTHGLCRLLPHTKDQIVCIDLSNCGLTINSTFLRELAGMRSLRKLTLDGNKFHLTHSGFPVFSPCLETLSVANCSGLRPTLLKNVKKTLRTLNWSGNLIIEEDKPVFLEWIKDSNVRSLDIDDCGFLQTDTCAFQVAFEHMPGLYSLSMAGNDGFQDDIFWWIYEFWKNGRLQSPFFSISISNMHICYPHCGRPVVMSTTRFGYIAITNWE